MGRNNRAVAVAVLGLGLVALLVMTGSGAMGYGMMGYGGPARAWGWGMMGMGAGWLVMLAFWGLLGVGVFYLMRPSDRTAGESAETVLRRRFAAGEIDRQQYEEMGRVLRDEPPRAA